MPVPAQTRCFFRSAPSYGALDRDASTAHTTFSVGPAAGYDMSWEDEIRGPMIAFPRYGSAFDGLAGDAALDG